VRQPVLPLLPADATPIGPAAGLVDGADGGAVFVFGQATFAFATDDEVGRRLAAVQLVATDIASAVAVAAGFGIGLATLWRWKAAYDAGGVAGLIPAKPGPKRPTKLTAAVVARIRELDADGQTLTAIAGAAKVSIATVRVALGRPSAGAGRSARPGRDPQPAGPPPSAVAESAVAESAVADSALADSALAESAVAESAVADSALADSALADSAAGTEVADPVAPAPVGDLGDGPVPAGLPVLPAPEPRTSERALARTGQLTEAPVVFTEGAHLPLAGLLLILPALAATGLTEAFAATYGRLRNAFYGLRSTVLMLLFLALLRDPRAEGATRIRPADLGRLLGLDRAPEVKTLRRKLTELAGCRRGAALQAALARAHAAARPDALGFLQVDGHVRVYAGTRDLPKTHIARMHLAGHATAETWVADADADPVLVVTAPPAASLASELVRLLPELRAVVGPDRRATVVFDRGGWSATTFAAIGAAGFDLLTYRKGPFDRLPDTAFTAHTGTDPDGQVHSYRLAETTVELPLPNRAGATVGLRQVHRQAVDGTQIPVLTSRTDLPAAEVCWRLSARWRQENYFKYARAHFALDALDSYADTPDDPTRPVPNPAKAAAKTALETARATVHDAETMLSEAIDDAAGRARRPGSGATATVDPAAGTVLAAARDRLAGAAATSRATPSHLPLHQVRPDARLLDEERKLLTHAIRMAAYNAESTLARMLRPHYSRADDEARALLREAFTLSGDLHITGDTLHVRLDPATAPRRSRALHALCQQLTETGTRYPETNLTISYSVKGQPDTP
jgi:transposase